MEAKATPIGELINGVDLTESFIFVAIGLIGDR
jgi:hypothetical protein